MPPTLAPALGGIHRADTPGPWGEDPWTSLKAVGVEGTTPWTPTNGNLGDHDPTQEQVGKLTI
jgi:hypothetical protein